MDVPVTAACVDSDVICGADAERTVNDEPLLFSPLTETTTFPLVAPVGTGALIRVFVH